MLSAWHRPNPLFEAKSYGSPGWASTLINSQTEEVELGRVETGTKSQKRRADLPAGTPSTQTKATLKNNVVESPPHFKPFTAMAAGQCGTASCRSLRVRATVAAILARPGYRRECRASAASWRLRSSLCNPLPSLGDAIACHDAASSGLSNQRTLKLARAQTSIHLPSGLITAGRRMLRPQLRIRLPENTSSR